MWARPFAPDCLHVCWASGSPDCLHFNLDQMVNFVFAYTSEGREHKCPQKSAIAKFLSFTCELADADQIVPAEGRSEQESLG